LPARSSSPKQAWSSAAAAAAAVRGGGARPYSAAAAATTASCPDPSASLEPLHHAICFVQGASRGLGLEFVTQLLELPGTRLVPPLLLCVLFLCCDLVEGGAPPASIRAKSWGGRRVQVNAAQRGTS
jgi:hypothetical protein